MMKTTKVSGLVLVLALLMTLNSAAGAQGPQPSGDEGLSASTLLSTGCVAGGTYDPACDVNRDNTINIVDIELTANHWGQAGTWTSGGWDLTGNAGTSPGTNFLGTTDNQPLELRVNNARALRLEPISGNRANVIGGYSGNSVTVGAKGATIGGGGASGSENRVTADYGTVGGGWANTASNGAATVAGGFTNTASGDAATVGGGLNNTASSYDGATVAGGAGNTASGRSATVGGGWGNVASGDLATVPGGNFNTAVGNYSFAAGRNAKANHAGTFVWADSKDYDYSTFGSNGFKVRATGGVRIVVAIDETAPGPETVATWYCTLSNGSSWSCSSSRSLKENLTPADGRQILERLHDVPVYRWNGKGQDQAVTHIGPISEDFYAAFDVGEDDRAIATIDLDGVALAAIQGLYDITQEQATQINALRAQNAQLEARLTALERAAGIQSATAPNSYCEGSGETAPCVTGR